MRFLVTTMKPGVVIVDAGSAHDAMNLARKLSDDRFRWRGALRRVVSAELLDPPEKEGE